MPSANKFASSILCHFREKYRNQHKIQNNNECLKTVNSAARVSSIKVVKSCKNQTIAKTIDDMSAPEIAAFIDCKYKMLVFCESENIESTVNDSIYDHLRISDIMFTDDESVHDGLKIKAGVYKGVSKPLIIDANGRARVVDTYSPCLQAVIFSK